MARDLHLRFSKDFGAFSAQREAMRAIMGGRYERVGYVGGLGSGKSLTGAVAAVALAAANPGLPGLMVAPTFGMLDDAVIPALTGVLEDNEIPYRLFSRRGRPACVLPWGSEIWLRSAEKPERLKGSNVAWLIMDEAGIVKQQAWMESVSRVRHPRARLLARVVVTTPEGFNWVYDDFGTDQPNTYTVHADTRQNRALPAGYVDQLLSTMDSQHAEAYVSGRFVPMIGRQVYYNFGRDKNIQPVEYDDRLPLFWSHDFNVNPMCSVLFQMPMVGNRPQVRVFDEIILPNSNTPEAVNEFMERYGDHQGSVWICGDASARARDTRQESARSDFDIIEDELKRRMPNATVDRYIATANPSLKRRFNTVNSLLENAAGDVTIAIHPRCEGLIASLERTVRKEGTQIIDKNTEWKWNRQTFTGVEHPTDALGYPLCKYFPDPREIRHSEAA